MIARVHFRPVSPPGHGTTFDFLPDRDISHVPLEIDTSIMFPARCGGRAWFLTPQSNESIRRFFPGMPSVPVRMFVCEHAIEIGD